MSAPAGRLIPLAGPEVPDPAAWDALLADAGIPAEPAVRPAGLPAALAGAPAVVLPLATGRDPRPAADAARAVAFARRAGAGHVLAPALADATGVIAALRANIRARCGPGVAAVVASAALDPWADAELFRIARLAWQYGPTPVEVGFEGAEPAVAAAAERARLLGATGVAVLRADLDPAPAGGAPLWRPAAAAELIARRVGQAVDAAACGDPGIAAALAAGHDHGPAHSHGPAGDRRHDHAHGPHGHGRHHDHHHHLAEGRS